MAFTPARAAAPWPPDDTEESVVGVDRHQLDIASLRAGINEEAHRVAAGGPLPWQAITQIMYLGCVRPDGSPYTVCPDVLVFPAARDRDRSSSSLREDGPPVLVVEVPSLSTYKVDLDLARGKGWSYRQAGVVEYLVLDPTRRYVPELGLGWRLEGGRYVPWLPDAAGRWQSRQIGVALGVEDGLAAVYGAGGERQLREGEVDPALEARRIEGLAEGRREGLAEGRMEGRVEGLAEGRLEAKREMTGRLARARFGAAPNLERRIADADEAALDALLDRLLTLSSPDDL